MEVRELRPGLWRWTARHPAWTPKDAGPEGWEAEVGCVYYEAPDAVVLVDPLVPEDEEERFWRALDRDVERSARPVVVLLTIRWHRRSVAAIVERYGARVLAQGEPLPGGVVGLENAQWAEETLYWLPEPAALVIGDVLLGDDGGVRVCPESWLQDYSRSRRDLKADLRSLLDLPIELLVVSHGEPVLAGARDALAQALEPQR